MPDSISSEKLRLKEPIKILRAEWPSLLKKTFRFSPVENLHNLQSRSCHVMTFDYDPPMQKRESFEAMLSSIVALITDAAAVGGGLWLAMWIRFDSGLISLHHPAQTMAERSYICIVATVVMLAVFAICELYKRPQKGRFEDKVPRIVKAVLWAFFAYLAFETAMRMKPEFSRKALVVSLFTVTLLVLIARYLVYRIEWNLARKMPKINHVLILGADQMALRLGEAVIRDPFLRSRVVGFVNTSNHELPEKLSPENIVGKLEELEDIIVREQVNQMILTDITLAHAKMVDIIVTCEKNLVKFKLVPDLFRILTSGVAIDTMDGIPVIGLAKWPLDSAFNRLRKRGIDILGAVVGLLIFSPIIFVCAILIKCTSPGPVFYTQIRYGEDGKAFPMHKLRTMQVDAEKDGVGWTREDDPRRTRIGEFLRKWNIDETPQFWDVLIGRMSIVGPRPERPHYVEQFKEVFSRYMTRHIAKPGITGWAQVNGLRGDTSIEERIKYDLYYLENWSLSLDYKIIMKTLFSNKNAY
jgi:Undecaprenyl-phosphate glucose phosphotransferase